MSCLSRFRCCYQGAGQPKTGWVEAEAALREALDEVQHLRSELASLKEMEARMHAEAGALQVS